MDDLIATLLGAVRDLDPVLRTSLAGLAIALETSVLLGLVVPGDTVVLIMSAGVTTPVEWVGMILAVLVGALCGESAGYAIGRWFGPRIRTSWLGRRLGPHRIDAAQRLIARRGGVAVFLSRFLPVLHSLVPLVAGMGRMRYRTFIAWTLPACAVWASAYVSAGAAAAASYTELAPRLHGASLVFVAAIVAFLLAAWGVKRLVRRRLGADLAADVGAGADADERRDPA